MSKAQRENFLVYEVRQMISYVFKTFFVGGGGGGRVVGEVTAKYC